MKFEQLINAKKKWSPNGEVSDQPTTARVSGLEILNDPTTLSSMIVPQGKEGADDLPAYIKQEHGIIGGQIDPRTGVEFYKNPIDRAAAASQYTINKIREKTKKRYQDHPEYYASSAAKKTLELTYSLTQPYLDTDQQRLDNTLDLQDKMDKLRKGYVPDYTDLPAAKRGKEPMSLPGFADKNIKNPFDNFDYKHAFYNNLMYGLGFYPKGNDYEEDPFGVGRRKSIEPNWNSYFEYHPSSVLRSGRWYKAFDDGLGYDPEYPYSPEEKKKAFGDKEGNGTTSKDSNKSNWFKNLLATLNKKSGPISGIGNNLLGLFGSAIGWGQYLNARKQRISRPDFYRANPTANAALRGLALLGYNENLIINDYRGANRAARYRLMNQGGLTAGLKYLGGLATDLASAKQIADFRSNAQQYRNQLKGQYYDALGKYGTTEQQQRMAAAQANYNAYTAAHNARQQQMEMGMYNVLNQGEQWYKNDQTRRMYNSTYGLYNQQLDQNQLKILAEYDTDALKRKLKSMNV